VKDVAQFAKHETKKKKTTQHMKFYNGKSHATKTKHRASPEKEKQQ